MGGAILPILGGVAALATGGLALGPELGLGAALGGADALGAGAGAAAGAGAGAAGLADAGAGLGAVASAGAGLGAGADAASGGLNLPGTLGALGQMAGGGAQLSKALYDKPNPQMPGYSGSHSSIPMVDINSLLKSVGGNGAMSPVPSLGSFRDNSLTHIMTQLGNGTDTQGSN